MLDKQDGVVWIGFIWLKIGTSGGVCEHGNELSGSINSWKFLRKLSDWWPLKED
jgi:hypothetical protein